MPIPHAAVAAGPMCCHLQPIGTRMRCCLEAPFRSRASAVAGSPSTASSDVCRQHLRDPCSWPAPQQAASRLAHGSLQGGRALPLPGRLGAQEKQRSMPPAADIRAGSAGSATLQPSKRHLPGPDVHQVVSCAGGPHPQCLLCIQPCLQLRQEGRPAPFSAISRAGSKSHFHPTCMAKHAPARPARRLCAAPPAAAPWQCRFACVL
jgi:hypothetical protein